MLLKDVPIRGGYAFLEPKCVKMKGHQTKDLDERRDADFAQALRARLGRVFSSFCSPSRYGARSITYTLLVFPQATGRRHRARRSARTSGSARRNCKCSASRHTTRPGPNHDSTDAIASTHANATCTLASYGYPCASIPARSWSVGNRILA